MLAPPAAHRLDSGFMLTNSTHRCTHATDQVELCVSRFALRFLIGIGDLSRADAGVPAPLRMVRADFETQIKRMLLFARMNEGPAA